MRGSCHVGGCAASQPTEVGVPRHKPGLTAAFAKGHRTVMRTAAVIGTGLIGTSAALALTSRGVTVHLSDADPDSVRTAASLGAGKAGLAEEPVDLATV